MMLIYGKCQYQPGEGRCTRKMEGGRGGGGIERSKRAGWREEDGIVREYYMQYIFLNEAKVTEDGKTLGTYSRTVRRNSVTIS